MNDRERRVARARLLRRDGKTYDEIRAVIGSVDDKTLQGWLRGIPRPAASHRSRANKELRRRCRVLRRRGYTYTEIAEMTGASPGSISVWVRDVEPRTRERAEARRLAALRASARSRAARAARIRQMHTDVAAATIGPLTEREVFLIGVGLYWAEGTKSKAYDVRERLTFVNSDPQVVGCFVEWLRLLGVSLSECRFRVHIHESADVFAAEQYWGSLVGVSPESFARTTLKRHNPKTNRLNVGSGYRGCLVVSVLKSASLYRSVAGWWRGMHAQMTADVRRASDWGDAAPWTGWCAERH